MSDTKVSWIRKRDLHVMSSGVVVFASDQRFQVLHADNSERWTLQIKYAQPRDAGVYECQVNTEPKIYMAFTLNVVESVANLTGPEYVMAGSNINLTCTLAVPHAQETPPLFDLSRPPPLSFPSNTGLVHWYQGAEILDYEGRVSITTGEEPAAMQTGGVGQGQHLSRTLLLLPLLLLLLTAAPFTTTTTTTTTTKLRPLLYPGS
ncbi:hypothetical protein Pmani_010770 [Petrolisthes manimaculis]|uniref:Ig-like domain-containing protein n=1 Tax=Petrolisthes manimaculis TaxID=1843537 RepID=A0AAE1Q1J1_9EUCA|nr:hypothetical protein Pmani_010770 [Petrolisthes manimaculis]